MITTDSVLGWAAIGAAASLAGMIWPFRRGAFGALVNLVVGIAGALAAAFLSYPLLPSTSRGAAPVRLFFAAVGALLALAVVHAAWELRVRRHERVARRS